MELASLEAALRTQIVGHPLLYYPSLSSTMDKAREETQKGINEGAVVLAGEQTAGRGRLGRGWVSPPGNLALSLVLRPTLELLPSLNMLASLSVVRAVEALHPLRPAIKWPNDVLIRGKKLCGILVENALRAGEVDYSIVGIGINVNLDPSSFPEISGLATSLRAELGRETSCAQLARTLLEEIEKLYLGLKAGEDIFPLWRSRLGTLGQRVRVTGTGMAEEGIAEDVERDGSLLLRRDDGQLIRLTVGEVSLRS